MKGMNYYCDEFIRKTMLSDEHPSYIDDMIKAFKGGWMRSFRAFYEASYDENEENFSDMMDFFYKEIEDYGRYLKEQNNGYI